MQRAMRYLFFSLVLSLYLIPARMPAEPVFPLSDSDPDSPVFERRVLAAAGVLEGVEPPVRSEDRTIYERLAPSLEDEPERAIRLLEEALNADSSPALRYLLGNLRYRQERWEAAEASLREAVEAFPSFRRAWRILGLLMTRKEEYAGAVEAWRQVIRHGGGDAQSYGLLAYAHLQRGHLTSALNAYEQARMFDPESLDFLRGQAWCLLELQRPVEAASLYDELIERRPEEGAFWIRQARAFLQAERPESAAANLEIARDLGAATTESLLLLADLYLYRDLPEAAVDVMEDVLLAKPLPPLDRLLRPLTYWLDRDFPAPAEAYLRRVKEAAGQTEAPIMQLAQARLDLAQGRLDEARERLAGLVRKDPINAQALILRGRVEQRDGRQEEADFWFQRAAGLDETAVEARVEQARLDVAAGNLQAALEHLQEAYRLDPREDIEAYLESVRNAVRARL